MSLISGLVLEAPHKDWQSPFLSASLADNPAKNTSGCQTLSSRSMCGDVAYCWRILPLAKDIDIIIM